MNILLGHYVAHLGQFAIATLNRKYASLFFNKKRFTLNKPFSINHPQPLI